MGLFAQPMEKVAQINKHFDAIVKRGVPLHDECGFRRPGQRTPKPMSGSGDDDVPDARLDRHWLTVRPVCCLCLLRLESLHH